MKNTISTLVIILFIGHCAYSQDIVSKKGEPFLPEANDWAIGIDVAPFFQYVGNIGNGNTQNDAPKFGYAYPVQVFGKWFKSVDFAWRGRVRLLGLSNQTNVGYVQDDLNTDPNNPYKQVEDKFTQNRMSTTLAFGMEKRKGKTRLQGFYGGEAVISFSNGSDKYSYGNDISSTNPNPSSTNFGNNLNAQNGYRVKEVKYGTGFSFGVRPFIGAEYFIFPKISIGGEFGYFLGYSSQKPAEVTSEYYDFTNAAVKTNTQKSGQYNKSAFTMDNDNLSGSIKLMLHF